MLLSAVSVLVVAQSSSEIPEGLMNNSVCTGPQEGKYHDPVTSRISEKSKLMSLTKFLSIKI